jgi:hypothetical protein
MLLLKLDAPRSHGLSDRTVQNIKLMAQRDKRLARFSHDTRNLLKTQHALTPEAAPLLAHRLPNSLCDQTIA